MVWYSPPLIHMIHPETIKKGVKAMTCYNLFASIWPRWFPEFSSAILMIKSIKSPRLLVKITSQSFCWWNHLFLLKKKKVFRLPPPGLLETQRLEAQSSQDAFRLRNSEALMTRIGCAYWQRDRFIVIWYSELKIDT